MRFSKSLKPLILNRLKASQLLLNRSDTSGSLPAFNFTKIISNLVAESLRKRVNREIRDRFLRVFFNEESLREEKFSRGRYGFLKFIKFKIMIPEHMRKIGCKVKIS